MKRLAISILCTAGLLCFAGVALSAGPVTYFVTVNTLSISGTVGSFDLNFNPGPLTTQGASVQIMNFASNGRVVGSPLLTGDVNGVLPATVTFDNGTVFNDYFQGITFGSTLTFKITLFGPALSSPDGASTSGSTFVFSMFSDAAGTVPALTTDQTNGFALRVDVNLDGTTTVTDFSSQTSTTTTSTATTASVPTLSSPALIALVLLLVGLGGFAARGNRGGLPRTLALAALLLLPFGFGTLWLSARPQGDQGNGSKSVTVGTVSDVIPPSSLTLLTRAQISVTASGLAYSRHSQTFNGAITITNISTDSIKGPFHVFINSPAPIHLAELAAGRPPARSSSAQHKPVGATLANPTGNFGGRPYITVPGVGSLIPGQSAKVNVQFKNPSNATINFMPVPYSGNFN